MVRAVGRDAGTIWFADFMSARYPADLRWVFSWKIDNDLFFNLLIHTQSVAKVVSKVLVLAE